VTDDLVKRLRFGVALDEQGDVSWCNQEAMHNAADRIEALQAALLEIFDHECRTSDKSFIAFAARDALWPKSLEKKDD
jgi:hypothetical protein